MTAHLVIGAAVILVLGMVVWGWIVIGDKLSPGNYENPVHSLVERIKDWLED